MGSRASCGRAEAWGEGERRGGEGDREKTWRETRRREKDMEVVVIELAGKD